MEIEGFEKSVSPKKWTNLYMGNYPEPEKISVVMVRRELGKYYKIGQSFNYDGFRFTVRDYDHKDDAYIVTWVELS